MSPLRDALRDLPDGVFFDLLESEAAYLVVLDVPGVSAETVDVAVEDGTVRVEARREKDLPEEYRYVEENRSLFFDASLPLPRDAAGDPEATVTDGVLEIRLPKDRGRRSAGDADGADGSTEAAASNTDAGSLESSTTADGEDGTDGDRA
ncbi:Hsp20/alpha crystallin family protein [Saliphagus sp. LR7]|uniref:Hsp20/alpha crystallin family protein n=1 Tax=Saliphagus sp. LR7 TaxID=2282654 RepID=UPI000DF82993|nr:Hsp20/alpha crystallin family protein [Saliphagus sp. LR7]